MLEFLYKFLMFLKLLLQIKLEL